MIRPFNRSDRDQLAALVNAHVAAVVPGASVSVNALLSRLEREPAELIVDPWVVERRTVVAVERDAVFRRRSSTACRTSGRTSGRCTPTQASSRLARRSCSSPRSTTSPTRRSPRAEASERGHGPGCPAPTRTSTSRPTSPPVGRSRDSPVGRTSATSSPPTTRRARGCSRRPRSGRGWVRVYSPADT